MFPGIWHTGGGLAAHHAQRDAAESRHKASDAARSVKELEDRLDKLTLVCMALWSLAKEGLGVSDEDLMARVRQIDLEDGQADGKVTKQAATCGKCGRVMSPRHRRCLYCGAANLSVGPFDAAS